MTPEQEKRLAEIESWQDQEDDDYVIDRITLDVGVVPWLCQRVREQAARIAELESELRDTMRDAREEIREVEAECRRMVAEMRFGDGY